MSPVPKVPLCVVTHGSPTGSPPAVTHWLEKDTSQEIVVLQLSLVWLVLNAVEAEEPSNVATVVQSPQSSLPSFQRAETVVVPAPTCARLPERLTVRCALLAVIALATECSGSVVNEPTCVATTTPALLRASRHQ